MIYNEMYAPVVKWISQRSTEPLFQIRILTGAPPPRDEAIHEECLQNEILKDKPETIIKDICQAIRQVANYLLTRDIENVMNIHTIEAVKIIATKLRYRTPTIIHLQMIPNL